MDIEIGTYSCLTGSSGAPCKHQAAVAIKYSQPSVTLPPVFSPESQKVFATLASGDGNTLRIELYCDLKTPDPEHQTKTQLHTTPSLINPNNSSKPQIILTRSESQETTSDEDDSIHQTDAKDPSLERQANLMFSELNCIFKNVTDRVKEGDTSLISRICKFILAFKKLQKCLDQLSLMLCIIWKA